MPWADAVLNPVNIRWSVGGDRYSLRDSDTRVLFVDDTFAPMVPALRERAPDLTTVVLHAATDRAARRVRWPTRT